MRTLANTTYLIWISLIQGLSEISNFETIMAFRHCGLKIKRIGQMWNTEFKRVRKIAKSAWFLHNVGLSVWPPAWKISASLEGFSWNIAFEYFSKTCRANARVILANTGHGPHSSKLVVIVFVLSLLVLLFMGILYYSTRMYIFILFYLILLFYYFILFHVLFVCICVQTTAAGCLPNCSWQIYQYINIQGVRGGTDQTSGGCSLC
jgi:hypothetical protein